MNAVILLCVAVAACLATTTTKPPATHEPNEHKNMLFIYNHRTHSILVKIDGGVECIVSQLTAPELLNVHTDGGMRAIELRVIASSFAATKVDPSTLNDSDVKHCGSHDQKNHTTTYYKL